MVDDIVSALDEVVVELGVAQIPYALCGGMAVNLHGHVRATRDIDLLIRAEALEPTRQVLRRLGFTLDAGPIPFAWGTETERVVHRISKVDGDDLLTVDLLLVTPILETAWETRICVRWRGHDVWAVSLQGLQQMKRIAGRAQDLADLENLGLLDEEAT